MRSTARKGQALEVAALAVTAFVIGACDARPPLVVEMDAGADREMRSRIPTCQPGIRDTACGGAADAHVPDPVDAGGVDGGSACQPTSGGTGDFRLVDVQPSQVTAHAYVNFTITYQGELPSDQLVWIALGNQIVHISLARAPTPSSFKMQFYVGPPAGPLRVRVLVGNSPTTAPAVAWLDCAVQVATLPAKPVLVPPYYDTDTLGIPLHPELAHRCARSAFFGLSNQGDALVTVRSVALTGGPGFAIADDQCTNRSLAYDADLSTPCGVKICFTDTTPGDETASLTFHTSAGDLTTDAASSVLPATDGLDRSFAGTGALLLPLSEWFPYVHVIRGATLLNNGMSLAMWDEFYGLIFVSSYGDAWLPAIGDPPAVQYWVLGSISAVRAGGPGQGIYALVSPSGVLNVASMIRFFDDGTRDLAFAGTGTLVLDDFLAAQYGGIEVQPSGRVLVIGTNYPSYGVRAFRPSGDEDVAYRTPLIPLADLNRGVIRAIDDGGRLYVATTSGVVRLGVDGGIDPGFSFSGSAEALAVDHDGRLLVAASGKLWRLDEGGAASPIPLAPQPELGARLFGIAVDTRGRILLTSSTGAVLRTLVDGTFDGRVGFAEGGAQAVACPRQAGCLIAGTLYEGEVNIARPSGTNVDESFVLRLAP